MRLSDEKSLLEQMTIEQARQNIALLKAEEIEMPKKWVLELLNTIEALQQENEQLRTQLDEWKYEVKCHMDEVVARDKEIEKLRIQIASMKKVLNLILGYSKNGCIYFIEEIAKEALSEDVTEKYHNPADITLLRKAKDCLKHGIKQLEKYINRFDQTPEEDACIKMHEAVVEIDKVIGGKEDVK